MEGFLFQLQNTSLLIFFFVCNLTLPFIYSIEEQNKADLQDSASIFGMEEQEYQLRSMKCKH